MLLYVDSVVAYRPEMA